MAKPKIMTKHKKQYINILQIYKHMKKIVLVLTALMVWGATIPVMAQNSKRLTPREQRNLEKQKKKEARREADLAELKEVNKLVNDTSFVFVAHTLYAKDGSSFHVDPAINFLSVNKAAAVYQFAFNGLAGWNGIGGATFEGKITTYKFKPSESLKKASNLSMNFRAPGVSGSPYVSMSFFGQKATIRIIFGAGNRIRLDGEIKPVKGAKVYKGQNSF